MARFVLIVAALALMGCSGGDDVIPTPTPLPQTCSITYQAFGSAGIASLTYANQTGGTSQVAGAALPWTLGPFTAQPNQFLYLSAQNDRDTGSVTVTILKNAQPFQTSTSSGAFVIATASGSC